MLLHEDPKFFSGVLSQARKKSGFSKIILEKDYYVVMMLKEIAEKQKYRPAFFKGGTALYKMLPDMCRFSEDIDLTVDVSQCRSKNQEKLMIEKAGDDYSCLKINKDMGKKHRGETFSYFNYTSLFEETLDPLRRQGNIQIEATSFTISDPHEDIFVSSIIYDSATVAQKEVLKDFGLEPFPIATITMERIFSDKIFAAESYFERGKRNSTENIPYNPSRMMFDCAKHLYDLTILLEQPRIQTLLSSKEEFEKITDYTRFENAVRHVVPGDRRYDTVDLRGLSYLNEASENKFFIKAFEEMQDVYVAKPEYRLSMLDIRATTEKLKEAFEFLCSGPGISKSKIGALSNNAQDAVSEQLEAELLDKSVER